jgi:hypothetical protein
VALFVLPNIYFKRLFKKCHIIIVVKPFRMIQEGHKIPSGDAADIHPVFDYSQHSEESGRGQREVLDQTASPLFGGLEAVLLRNWYSIS